MTEDLSTHRVTPIMRALLAAVAVTVLLLGLFYWNSNSRANDLDRKADALSESLDARAEVIDELAAGQDAMRAQLEAADIEPAVPDPEVTIREVIRETGATGATGARGEQGIAGRDGRDGITPACWLEASQCQGAKGDKGDPGSPPTMADLDAAIIRYCETHQCKGDQGDQGAPGPACPAGYEPRVIESGPQKGWIACAPTGEP